MTSPKPDPVSAVLNQPSRLEDDDRFGNDAALAEAVNRHGAGWAHKRLANAGITFATSDALRLASLANDNPPVLSTHDRQGRRVDRVDFHPAWDGLLDMAIGHGIVSLPWSGAEAQRHVVRAALFYLYAQTESGTQCPLAMSFGAVPVLRRCAGDLTSIEAHWIPKLLSNHYDPRPLPVAEKRGALFGMGMTERQGGSDVRSNITVAAPAGRRGRGRQYTISGHKWFLSAPMCDAFLILAQTTGGLSCFLMPRVLDDGAQNHLRLQRLKGKLGNRSNASSEVEFHDAVGYLLGDEGRGVATIIEMAAHTRLDCVLATAGMQRRALAIAIHHARQRVAFGKPLVKQPLMTAVLADLAVEAEASTSFAMYLAHCFDPGSDDLDRLVGRLLTPAAKLHVCKRGPQFVAEAMEVLGGNGYVEENELPRIYREMPLLSIWEGSGNVMCLDVLRVLAKEPEAADALRTMVSDARGDNSWFDSFLDDFEKLLNKPTEADGRRVAHAIALAVQGALLVKYAPNAVADAFCRTRLAASHRWGSSFGMLTSAEPCAEIVDRALPPS